MKKLFRGIHKRRILNILGLLTVVATQTPTTLPNGGCTFLFYEPKKPELLGKVTKEELLGTKR